MTAAIDVPTVLPQLVGSRPSRARGLSARVAELTGLTTAGLMLLGTSILFWLVGYWVGGRPLYLISYGALAVLIGSWLYGRRTPPLTGVRSDLRPRVREGESMTVDVALTANRRMSTLILEEVLPPSLGASPQVPVAELAQGQSAGHRYELVCSRRGVYSIGPLRVRWGDPFGLTQRRREICPSFPLYVHPRVEPAADRPTTRLWEDPPQRPPFSRPWPSGLEFYGMRPYAPGDDLRRIVWRAYARTGSLLVREAEQGVTDKMVLLVDLDRAAHSSGEVSPSFETAMRAAGSLAAHHLREGYTVTVEGNQQQLSRPLRGAAARIAVLDALAGSERETSNLDDLLHRVGFRIPPDVELFVITPRLTKAAVTRLRLIADRGAAVTVVALVFDDEAVDHLGVAATLGLRVIEMGPHTNLTAAFRFDVGGGIR